MTKARTLADFDSTGVLTSASTLDATKLSGNLPALNGSSLTNLPAGATSGTFTPSMNPTSGSFTTVGTCTGFYTKVGDIVHIQMNLVLTDKGSGSGHLNVTGLPYTSAAAGIIHTRMLCRETETNGSLHDCIMSRDANELVVLSAHMANGAGYSINGSYRV